MNPEKSKIPPPLFPRRFRTSPLTSAQDRLWFLQQLDPEDSSYNSAVIIKLHGTLRIEYWAQACTELSKRHTPLRTIFPVISGTPVQVVQPPAEFPVPWVDLSSLKQDSLARRIKQHIAGCVQPPFDLIQGPVCRCILLHLSPLENIFVFCIHHIGFDAWSKQILVSDLLTIYSDLCADRNLSLPELRLEYPDYAIWQHDWMSGDALENHLHYWLETLAGVLPEINLPLDHPHPAYPSHWGKRVEFQIPADLEYRIKEFCSQFHFTSFHVYLSVYSLLLAKYTGQEDLIIGCPFANRMLPEVAQLIGLFMNTLPIRVSVVGHTTGQELLTQIREIMLNAGSWQSAPLETIVSRLSPTRSPDQNPLFQVAINMRNTPPQKTPKSALSVEELRDNENLHSHFDLTLEFEPQEGSYQPSFVYNTDVFDEKTISRMALHYLTLLEGFIGHINRPIKTIELLSSREKRSLLFDWNDTDQPILSKCLHSTISDQSMKQPFTPAVVFHDEVMTYEKLERSANQLAGYLVDRGVQPGTMVGILLPRSPAGIVTQLAVLKAGGIIVSLDSLQPAERLRSMIHQAKVEVTVTIAGLAAEYLEGQQVLCLDLEQEVIRTFSEHCTFPPTNSEVPIYLMFTSGSTGVPKAVLCHQLGVLNYLQHTIRCFNLKSGDRVLQLTPFSFDASIRDTLGVLYFGGTVVLTDDREIWDPNVITQMLVAQNIDCILSIVPTMLREILLSIPVSQPIHCDLRLIMPSGEVLHLTDITALRKLFGDALQIVNQYGPTECSMITSQYKVPFSKQGSGASSIPIGKPIQNARCYVLDKDQQLVPPGIRGELYIGGAGVGLGYQNLPDLSTAVFLPDPFFPGQKMYRSGDIVRLDKDGNLNFVGRTDTQVKVRGYRVELGEIEAAIHQYPGIQDAVVLCHEDGHGGVLAAYITQSTKKSHFSNEGLRAHLERSLPFYMIPKNMILLQSMKRTPHGKVDRNALPIPEWDASETERIEPRNDDERKMAAIWKRVLNVDRIGIRDNFFNLGGHSLLAVKLIAFIEEEFGQTLPIRLIFLEGTIENLTRQISRHPK